MEGRTNGLDVEFVEIVEERGLGISAKDRQGNTYRLGSARLVEGENGGLTGQVFLSKNEEVLASLSLSDEIRPDARHVMNELASQGISTYLLSGDKTEKVDRMASELGIQHALGEQLPGEKMKRIRALSKEEPTAMVGDGINDAPALAQASVGISLGGASQAAIQSAQVVLLQGRLKLILDALGISRLTLLTIKQNLFWAFAYNIVAIPIAALGFLNPMWGALFMAFSDVVVIGNSIRLKFKKLPS